MGDLASISSSEGGEDERPIHTDTAPVSSAARKSSTTDSAPMLALGSHQNPQTRPSNARARQFDTSQPSSTTGVPGLFNMAPVTNALPHGNYDHGVPSASHQPFSHTTSPAMAQPMMHHSISGPQHGSMSTPSYYMQQTPMSQYYSGTGMAAGSVQPPFQGARGYYQVQFVMEHPQPQGYYSHAPQYQESGYHVTDPTINRQYTHGHTQVAAHSSTRRSPNRISRPTREQVKTTVDTRLQSSVRGPPRKPHQSGHAVWIGNLPLQTDILSLVHHVCEMASGLQSVFLISKSNCAFANFKEVEACLNAQKALHDSKFQSVRLVCRLRKSTAEGTSGTQSPNAAHTYNSATTAISEGQVDEKLTENAEQGSPAIGYLQNSEVMGEGKVNAHRDRFFILKSLAREDLELSVQTGIWATQSHNEGLLNNAFKTADNVYLIFSANKSGEYFGFARMTSEINQDPDAMIQFAPQTQTVDEADLPKAIPAEASMNTPRGRIIDDTARGTVLWEVEDQAQSGEIDYDDDTIHSRDTEEADEEMQTRGKPFTLAWLSTARLPFYRTRGLRNPWNSNREVKIARDGTEIEPSVGRRLIGLINHHAAIGPSTRSSQEPMGNFNPAARHRR